MIGGIFAVHGQFCKLGASNVFDLLDGLCYDDPG